jgi:cobalt-zinc-cadmium resistance protein CzcA
MNHLKNSNVILIICLILTFSFDFSSTKVYAQRLSESEAISKAFENNLQLQAAANQIDYFRQLKKSGSDIGKLSIVWMNGQYNTIEKDNNITLTQNIPFPGTIGAHLKLGEEQIVGASKNLDVIKNNLAFEIKSTYETLLYQNALHQLLQSQDSLFTDFSRASSLRYKTGESNLLEMTTAETQLQEVKNTIHQNEADIIISQKKLQALLKSEAPIEANTILSKRFVNVDELNSLEQNPSLLYSWQQVKISEQEKRLEKNLLMPDLTFGYFNQSLMGYQNTTGNDVFYGSNKRFQGFMAGLSVPLWFSPQVSRAKAANFMEESTRKNAEYYKLTLNNDYDQALRELSKNESSLSYYETSALKNADLILSQSQKAFKSGEIGYIEYLQSIRTSISIKSNYILSLHQYNLSVIKVEHLTGKQF